MALESAVILRARVRETEAISASGINRESGGTGVSVHSQLSQNHRDPNLRRVSCNKTTSGKRKLGAFKEHCIDAKKSGKRSQ